MSDVLDSIPSTDIVLQALTSRFLASFNVSVSVLRLDGIHPSISGNKWFKLRPVLQRACRLDQPILSFGGAWSNHIHSLAWAGYRLGLKTVGVIRGEAEYADNAMLRDAQRWGMHLHFVSRGEYRLRHDPEYHQVLQRSLGPALIVPEGGSALESVRSVSDVWRVPALASAECDVLVTAVGTGATLSGLVAGRPQGVDVLGVPVLKHDQRLVESVQSWLSALAVDPNAGWALLPEGHGGGYARVPAELARMIAEVECRFDLPLDPVYTGKAFMALFRQVVGGGIARGSRVILLHTGGMQGRRGMEQTLSALAPDFQGPLAL